MFQFHPPLNNCYFGKERDNHGDSKDIVDVQLKMTTESFTENYRTSSQQLICCH